MDRKEIERRLRKLTSRHAAGFGVRAAAMVLPVLVAGGREKEPFRCWRPGDRGRNVLAVLRAINISWFISLRKDYSLSVATAAAAADAYAAAAYAAAAAAADAAYAAAAVAAVAAAAADAAADAVDAAADAADFIGVKVDVAKMLKDTLTELENCSDISVGMAKLLPAPATCIFPELSRSFIEQLRSLGGGFDYWADWYEERLAGKEADPAMLEQIVTIPKEILDQGPAAVNAYLKSLRSKDTLRSLNRVRAIFIGHGEAGKTSLIRALHGEEVVVGKEEMTPGVDIREWTLPESDIKAHFWDFGGQVMAHATHQFFLRERCVYVLVMDGRTDINANQQAEYWLEHVRAFGNKAPVLLVGNKMDLAPVNLDLHTLRENHPNIIGFFPVSCTGYQSAHKEAFTRFVEVFTGALREVGMHTIRLKESHYSVLEALQTHTAEKGSAFLAKERFEAICAKCGVPESGELDRDWLLDLLDKLGMVIHFPNISWMDKYVLNPRWLTYGVYTLLYSEDALRRKGRLTERDVTRILCAGKVRDNLGNQLEFDNQKCHFIVEAMRQFQLCYRLPRDNDTLIIPDLLPSDRPENLAFNKEGSLAFDFDFEGLLPRHLMSGFIVHRHGEINANLVWQNGVQLRSATLDAEALARVNYHNRRFSLWVSGKQAGRYFSVLYDDVKQMLARMPELPYKEWVRLPGSGDDPGRRAGFQHLLALEAAGERRYICEYGRYDLAELLKIMPSDKRREVHKTVHVHNGHYFESVRGENIQFGDTIIVQQLRDMKSKLGTWQDQIEIELSDDELRGQALRELEMIRKALTVLEQNDAGKEEKKSAVDKLSRFGDRLKGGAGQFVAALKGIKDGGQALSWLIGNVPTIVEKIMTWMG